MSKLQDPKKKRTTVTPQHSKNRQLAKKTKKKNFLTEGAEDAMVATTTPQEPKMRKPEVEAPPKSSMKSDPRQRWCEKVFGLRIKEDITKEFTCNRTWKPEKRPMTYWEKNEPKNRYDDIMCLDSTRVVLKDRPDDADYIHASWMTMPDGQKYISTQGPITTTIEDFWHMIFTEKSNVIVMLTALEDENATSKCARYFPKKIKNFEVFGAYKVTWKSSEAEPFPSIQHNILVVEKEDGGTKMEVNHLIYDTWTDHFGPETPDISVGLMKMSRKLAAGKGPITVHCSAGIGRTCTFIGIDWASQKIAKEGEAVDMLQVMKDLRQMRYHAIQSSAQYVFIFLGVLELFVEENVIPRAGRYEAFLKVYQETMKRLKERFMKAKKSKDY